jgi:hypothetical protein
LALPRILTLRADISRSKSDKLHRWCYATRRSGFDLAGIARSGPCASHHPAAACHWPYIIGNPGKEAPATPPPLESITPGFSAKSASKFWRRQLGLKSNLSGPFLLPAPSLRTAPSNPDYRRCTVACCMPYQYRQQGASMLKRHSADLILDLVSPGKCLRCLGLIAVGGSFRLSRECPREGASMPRVKASLSCILSQIVFGIFKLKTIYCNLNTGIRIPRVRSSQLSRPRNESMTGCFPLVHAIRRSSFSSINRISSVPSLRGPRSKRAIINESEPVSIGTKGR